MRSISTYISLICSLVCACLLVSCASPQYKARIDMTASEGIIWPGKSEKPRIKYLWSLKQVGEEEREAGSGYLDFITGRTAEDVTNPQAAGTLLRPQAVYADDRRLYIADPGASRVTVIDRKSMDVMQIIEAKGESLDYPISVVAGSDGRIYVSDPERKQIISYAGDGKFLYFFEGETERPTGLAIDRQRGLIYAADTLGHTVYSYDLDGKRKGRIGSRGIGDGEFNYPSHLFVDKDGTLFVTDFLNFRVQLFSPEGKFLRQFGFLGDNFSAFDKPKGIAVDREGHVYVADAGRDMVKIFDQQGNLLLFFGEKGQRYGNFYLPTGIFIDEKDIIYVADTINMRIQAFQFLGGD